MAQILWLVPALPLLAFPLIVLFGKKMPGKGSYLAILAVLVSFGISLVAFILKILAKMPPVDISIPWAVVGQAKLNLGILYDPLTAIMLLVVTIVSLMVHIYSIGYMHDDRRFHWYFAVLALFTAAMLSLVLANNLLQFLISWELMGMCSYLLIGFWYDKPEAMYASKKAFITTRVGDIGLLLGAIMLFWGAKSLHFETIFKFAEEGGLSVSFITAACILLFIGAMGKSAQFPLHVWLPDAMAGPTPASALIHAATMVAAGVYLVARCYPLFELAPTALLVVASIGTITALIAATIAVAQSDIKKVLAYSTISQLGYMMAALGVGGYVAGVFHLVTHAFFKSLLFLGSGSVIHALHTQDMYEMGGLSKKMKITTFTFVLASLAIAGIPPLSGFWSKDEILAHAYHGGYYFAYFVLLFTAFLTAFYMFRLCFLTFFGESRNEHAHPHESPPVMAYPLIVLCLFAVFLGFVNAPFFSSAFTKFVAPHEHILKPDYALIAFSVIAALTGIYLASQLYLRKSVSEQVMIEWLGGTYETLKKGYFIDDFYTRFLVEPFKRFGELIGWFDRTVVDGLVNGIGYLAVRSSDGFADFDKRVVDGIVDYIAERTGKVGDLLRTLQTGHLQKSAVVLVLGSVFVAVVLTITFVVRGI